MTTKLIGTKLKMTQIFKDGISYGVTPVLVTGNFDLAGIESGTLAVVVGASKGHGFAGVVKRHGFHGGPASHGQKDKHRSPGSIGSTAPQRVLKGRRMAGRMGMDRITTKNVPIVEVDFENKMILLNGAVPGTIGRRVELVLPVELMEVEVVEQTQREEKSESVDSGSKAGMTEGEVKESVDSGSKAGMTEENKSE